MIHEPLFDPKADSSLSDEALKSKRDRYANFRTHEVISRIAKKSLGADIVRIEPLGLGTTNAFDHLVFRAHTDKGLRVVFRFNTDTIVAEDFLVEAEIYNIWHRNGVPSPEVYDVALRSNKNDPDYILMENVGTHDIEEYLKLYPESADAYTRASGAFLKKIHSIPVNGFGILTLKSGVLQGCQSTWREAMYTRLDRTLEYLKENHLIDATLEKDIRETFAQHDRLLDFEEGVTLHGDYHNANIMIDHVTGGVVSAIDLSQAKSGDPVYDIAFYGTYVPREAFETFCEGYFNHSHKPANFGKKIALYQLRIYLSKAKLRKRFGYDERISSAIDGIRNSLKKLA